MKNFVKIYDLVSFNLIEATSVKDSLPMMTTGVDGQPAKGLLVKIAASHAGILTKNNMFYLPEKMKTGVKTFTDGYAKPILLNHDTDLPPIGRVKEANYIDTSHIVKDKLTAGKIKDSKITSTLIEDFCNGKMSEGAQIDAVRMLFNDSLLDDPTYAGLGYAEIVAQITDKEAIERFLDGRYLTGSVGAATDRATCSVCKNDWTKEGPCFPAETEITLEDGTTKPISEIKVGDLVLTHTGTVGKVTKIMDRHYNDDLIVIDRLGTNQPLLATKNHPIYHSKIKTTSHRINKTDKRSFEKVLIESGFIAAEELYESEGYISVPVPQYNKSSHFSKTEAALLGLYAAEGSHTNSNCLEFSIHEDEVKLFDHYFTDNDISYAVYPRENSKGVSCRFSSPIWANICDKHIGRGAKTKKLSKEIIYGTDEVIKAFIGAFIDGDGSLTKEQQKINISTVSKDLSHQLLTMCNNIGLTPNFYKNENSGGPSSRDKKSTIYLLQIAKSQLESLVPYSVKLQKWLPGKFSTQHKIILDNKIFSRFSYNQVPFHGTVYNLEIEAPNNEHSYIANDIAVHNCEHRPGKIYDSKKAFLIMGNFTYEEYSVVSKPADGHSKVIEVYFNGIRDSIDLTDSEFSGRIPEIILQFPKEIRQMPSGEVKDTEKKTEEVKTEEVKDQQVTESFDDLVTRILDSEKTPELSDSDDEKLYQLMLDEMKSVGLTEKEIEDAKLSTDKRKSLPKTSFCAPNRAFPVPDCAHVTAARRLIGKYKGPGDKTAILACVERKAKAMSCGTVKDETDKESNLPESVKTMQTLSPEDFKKTLDAVLELAKQKDPKVIRDLVKLEEPALVQEVVALEVKMGTLLDELKQAKEAHAALLEENKLVASEAAVLQDSLLKNKSELRNGKVKFASLLKSLKAGNPLSKEDEDKLLSLEDQVLSSELENLTKEVDIKKITDKLNDGTSRNPSGTVESPSGNQGAPKFTVEDTKKELKRIQEKYLEMTFQNSYTAERWKKVQLERMIKEGKITIETAQKIV